MAIHYVDYEGAAGTGDGSSFANRAAMFRDIDGNVAAGDTIRIKKSPDPTSLGSGQVRAGFSHMGYNATSKSGGNITYSSSDGETKLTQMGRGWMTGDILHISHADSNTGKSISGLWRVTREDGTANNASLKLDNFPGVSDTSSSSTTFYYFVAKNAIYLNTDDITKSIACRDAYRSAWTADGSGVVTSYTHPSISSWTRNYDYTLFTGSDRVYIPSSEGAGRRAYYELPSTLDLSSYQQISFAVRATGSYSMADTSFSLRLCTDTAGNTSVHTIPIQFGKLKSDTWGFRTVDLGTNLNSAIKSVALYKDDASAATIDFDLQNIIACKADSAADSLTLDKLVGLNTNTDTSWYPVYAIWDNIIYLDVSGRQSGQWGYYGASACQFSATNYSATIYQRKQFRIGNSHTTESDENKFDLYDGADGTEASPITISGGWDSTSMSSRNGKTCISLNGANVPYFTSKDHIHFEHLYTSYTGDVWDIINPGPKGLGWSGCGYSKFADGFMGFGSGTTVTKFGIDFMIGLSQSSYAFQFKDVKFTGSTLSDFYIKAGCGASNKTFIYVPGSGSVYFDTLDLIACTSTAIFVGGGSITVDTLNWGYNGETNKHPYVSTGLLQIQTVNIYNWYYLNLSAGGGKLHVNDYNEYFSTIDDDTDYNYRFGNSRTVAYSFLVTDSAAELMVLDALTTGVRAGITNWGGVQKFKNIKNQYGSAITYFAIDDDGGRVEEQNYELGTNDRVYYKNFIIYPETTIRHTASGKAWRGTGTAEAVFELGKVVVSASSAVTIGLWTYKTSTDGLVTLEIPGDFYMGTDTSTANNSSASVDTWVKIETSFTPTEAGVIEINVRMSSGGSSSESVYIDDLEVSQA